MRDVDRRPSRAFTVTDAGFWPGTVALLNSLRLTGNDLPLTVLDLGCTAEQRRRLEPHCEVVAGPRGRSPALGKLLAPMRADEAAAVVIDSDIVVTGPLSDAVRAASEGAVFAFADVALTGRWCAEWTEHFGLRAPLRREPYLNAGFVALPRTGGSDVLARWADLCDRLAAAGVPTNPDDAVRAGGEALRYTDQDAFNALMMSEVPADGVRRGARRGMPMHPDELAETTVVDLERLRCEWGGEPVTVLHAIGHRKPWKGDAARELRATAYLRCLERVLTGPDLTVRIPVDELVPWLRPGRTGSATRRLLHAYDAGARRTRPARHRVAARVRRAVGRGGVDTE